MSSIAVHSLPEAPVRSAAASPPPRFPSASVVTMETQPSVDGLKVGKAVALGSALTYRRFGPSCIRSKTMFSFDPLPFCCRPFPRFPSNVRD